MTRPFDLQSWLASNERTLHRDGNRIRAVSIRRRFDAPVERVWAAWTDGWKTKIVSGTPSPGEVVVLDLGQPHRTTCRILVCDPPNTLAVTWTYGDAPEPALPAVAPDEVEVRLTPTPDGQATLLELEHRSDSDAPWPAGIGAGWEAGLLMFDTLFRGQDPATIPAAEAFPALDAFWTDLVAKPA